MQLKKRILIFLFIPLIFFPNSGATHSPWGQYQVYRQKHLLILSTKDDLPSYEASKKLVTAINKLEPSAKARPARAKNLTRAHSLLKSNQMQFAILSKNNIEMIIIDQLNDIIID